MGLRWPVILALPSVPSGKIPRFHRGVKYCGPFWKILSVIFPVKCRGELRRAEWGR